MCTAIKIENVNKSFGETVVLSNVNIEFEKGKVHGLIGRNGSGKTILIASHSAEDIDVLCDTVHEMDKGVLTTLRTYRPYCSPGNAS